MPRTLIRGRSPGGREGFLVHLVTTIGARVNPVALGLVPSQRHSAKGHRPCRAGAHPAADESSKDPSDDLPDVAQGLFRCYNIRTHVRGNSVRRSVSWTEEYAKLNLQNAKQNIAISPLSGRRTICLLVLIESRQDR